MNKSDFYAMRNPLDIYHSDDFPKQEQPAPGVQAKMKPVPDCGEKTYVGSNRLEGRKALVTGGDSGIGRAAAIAYAREGADLAVNYLPTEEEDAQQVKRYVEEAGRKCVLIPGDLGDESFNQRMVERAAQELGGLDILALVAGRQVAVEKLEDLSTGQLKDVFAVNVFSLFWTIKAALPFLPEGATIITTSSIQAHDPSAHLVDYASTKAAIKAFTQALGKQLASRGIRVNAVAPGPVWTALEISGGQLPEIIPQFGQDAPLKRAGQPAELAGVYVYLASQESSYVTCEMYGVTGGMHL